jgi:hypothetical protein
VTNTRIWWTPFPSKTARELLFSDSFSDSLQQSLQLFTASAA